MWRTVSDHLLNTTDADLTIMETAAFKKSMYIPSPTSVPPLTEYIYLIIVSVYLKCISYKEKFLILKVGII